MRRVTGTTGYPLLSAPTVIGPLALRNRMVLCPMGDNLAEPGGAVSERQLGYYEARAAGGAGLLLVGSVGVAASGRTAAEQTGAHLDEHVDGLRRLADVAHGHGAAIAAQLVHCGPNAVLDIAEGRPVLVPSRPPRLRMDALSGMLTGEELTAMTEPFTRPTASFDHHLATDDDLAAVVAQYAAAAARVRDAGFDGIEVHAGHGYLIDTFLSPLANQREDDWGGDVAGRARLLLTVLAAIRAEVGPSMAVWIRLNGQEVGKDGGETIDDAIAVAQLAEAGGAEAIHVTAYADPGQATGITSAHTPHTPGARLADAAAIRAAVAIPVITYGRLEPVDAEAALAEGTADLVAFGRKLLAGPDLPAAILAGRPTDARPCAYQYRCIGNIFLHRPLACAVSPDTTREVELRLGRATVPEHVLVVGGGPVGLEVAHRLATAGHRVTLWEAGDRLGGNLVVAGRADPALAPLATWLIAAAARAGVEVVLERTATVEAVAALGVDRVVVATGARWQRPTADPDAVRVLTPDDLRSHPAEPFAGLPHRLVVLGSGKVAVSLAGAVAALSHEVALVAPDPVLAPELGLPGRFRLVDDLEHAGVELHLAAAVDRVTARGVTLGDGTVIAADAVLAAVGRTPTTGLAEELAAAGDRVDVLGDATGAFGLESGLLAAARLAAGHPVTA